jgi:hypothetical protein
MLYPEARVEHFSGFSIVAVFVCGNPSQVRAVIIGPFVRSQSNFIFNGFQTF